MTTPIDLAALRALAEAASPGPWMAVMTGRGLEVQRVVDNKSLANVCQWTGDHPARTRNLDYIAVVSPDVVLQLLDALERALAVTEGAATALGRTIALIEAAHVDQLADYQPDHDDVELTPDGKYLLSHAKADLRALARWRNGIIKERT